MKITTILTTILFGVITSTAEAQVRSDALYMTYSAAGKPRNFYYIPATGQPKGLIILLHGLGGSAENYMSPEYSYWIDQFKGKGYAFAIPNGSNSLPKEFISKGIILRSWSTGPGKEDCCSNLFTRYYNYLQKYPGSVESGAMPKKILPSNQLYTEPVHENDLEAVRVLAADGAKALGLPAKKVILIGMSNGGIMAYKAQCSLPSGTFGAVVSLAGSFSGSPYCGTGASPNFTHIHGDADDIVPFNGGITKIANLYPAYYFPNTVKKSFNIVSTAAGCSFGVNGESATKISFPANPASLPSEPYSTINAWDRYIAKCSPGKNYNLIVFKNIGHGLDNSAFKIGISYSVDLIANN